MGMAWTIAQREEMKLEGHPGGQILQGFMSHDRRFSLTLMR